MTLSPVLARELATARSRFNAQVAAARRARSGFDTGALNDAVRTRVDPLAVAVEAVAPDRTAAVIEAAFTLTVALVDQGMVGARRALIDRAWTQAAVALASAVAERPSPVLAMLSNAVLTLAATPGARPDEWIARMTALGSSVTADTMGAVGQVVAWRSGMAHYRQGALACADALPERLALMSIGATGSWRKIRAALAASRWWTPEPRTDVSIRFGGFVGFGGPFESPPEVRAGSEGFVVRAGRRIGLLVADIWGATLHPSSEDEFDQATPSVAARVAVVGFPDQGVMAAVAGESVALASPYSHFIRVQPWAS